ncbi:MAG: endolytic transglycosylase MltG [Patescibacteria group bacterium]
MNQPFFKSGVLAVFLCIAVPVGVSLFLIAPMNSYPRGSTVLISAGSTITESAHTLEGLHIVRSATVFSLLVQITNGSGVIAGTYALKERENAVSLAYRFSHGDTGITLVRVTIPEGVTTSEMGDILLKSLGSFDIEKFKELAKKQEGYLFPETYFFLPNISPEEVIAIMRHEFDEKIKPLQEKITTFGRPLGEVVTMASILEKEARQADTRKIVAGILWKRISLSMPLQVDAVFGYILGKSGYAPTLSDLKIASPYNTYLHTGLPPGPIGNPGLEALEDAVSPTKNPFLYYLTDKEGNIYYAKTFAEHVANKNKLR